MLLLIFPEQDRLLFIHIASEYFFSVLYFSMCPFFPVLYSLYLSLSLNLQSFNLVQAFLIMKMEISQFPQERYMLGLVLFLLSTY